MRGPDGGVVCQQQRPVQSSGPLAPWPCSELAPSLLLAALPVSPIVGGIPHKQAYFPGAAGTRAMCLPTKGDPPISDRRCPQGTCALPGYQLASPLQGSPPPIPPHPSPLTPHLSPPAVWSVQVEAARQENVLLRSRCETLHAKNLEMG